MFALLKPTFSLPLRPPLLARSFSLSGTLPYRCLLHPTASADRLAPCIFAQERSISLSCDPAVSLSTMELIPHRLTADLDPCDFGSYLVFRVCLDLYRSRGPHRNSALPLDVQSTAAPQRISGEPASSDHPVRPISSDNCPMKTRFRYGSVVPLTKPLPMSRRLILQQARVRAQAPPTAWSLRVFSLASVLADSHGFHVPHATRSERKLVMLSATDFHHLGAAFRLLRLAARRFSSSKVALFGNLRIYAYFQLPEAFRRLLRPSSSLVPSIHRVGDKRTRTADIRRRFYVVRDPWMPKASLGDLVVPTGGDDGSVHDFPSFSFAAFRSKVEGDSASSCSQGQLDPLPQRSQMENPGEPPTPTTVHVQDTIITAWTIRHPTRNRNDPIARAELYQLSYIPRAKWSMHEVVRYFFYSFPCAAGHPGLEPETSPVKCVVSAPFSFPIEPNLNLCSRDSCPYTDKDVWILEKRGAVWSLPDRPIPRVIESWIYIGSHPNRPIYPPERSLFQTPFEQEEYAMLMCLG
nr:hypothetical protein Ahy_A03g013504 [Ipomoea trifida]